VFFNYVIKSDFGILLFVFCNALKNPAVVAGNRSVTAMLRSN